MSLEVIDKTAFAIVCHAFSLMPVGPIPGFLLNVNILKTIREDMLLGVHKTGAKTSGCDCKGVT